MHLNECPWYMCVLKRNFSFKFPCHPIALYIDKMDFHYFSHYYSFLFPFSHFPSLSSSLSHSLFSFHQIYVEPHILVLCAFNVILPFFFNLFVFQISCLSSMFILLHNFSTEIFILVVTIKGLRTFSCSCIFLCFNRRIIFYDTVSS